MGYNGPHDGDRQLTILDIIVMCLGWLGLLAAVVVFACGMGLAYKQHVLDVYRHAGVQGY